MAVSRKKEMKTAVRREEKPVISDVAEVKAAEEQKTEVLLKAEAPGAETGTRVFVQYMDREILTENLVAEARAAYVKAGNMEADIKTIDVYIKPEENTAYYVVNGTGSDEYRLKL